MVRGNVTALPPQAKNAVEVKKGLSLPSDTSVYAQKRSFAKIKLTNGSVLTVGPESKVVIETSAKDDTSMVSLLTGKIRAKVQKDANNDKKVLVKTSSAIMGVRGTDFQAAYNHKAQRTSLLTYEGKVAIKKVDPKLEKQIVTKKETKIEEIKNMITDKDQAVEKGDYINVAEKAKMEKPIKINPVQYVVLKKDDSLGVQEAKVSKKEVIKEAKKVAKEFKKEAKAKGLKQEAHYGFVDPKTGFYVPPVDVGGKKMVGKIDMNGNYIPPKGLKIDDEKGFVVVEKNAETMALAEKINKKVEAQIAIDPEEAVGYSRFFNVNEN